MDNSSIFKIWGLRKRILLTDTTEIDLLHLKRNTFCSTHRHDKKINKFIVISGCVKIESEFGDITLHSGEEFEIRPPLKHRFFAKEESTMIELAYVEEGKIDPNDIDRESQGGMIINGKEMTFDEMRKKGMLNL